MLRWFLTLLILSWRGESWFHKWLACFFTWTDRTPFECLKSIFIIFFYRTFLLINYWLDCLQRFFQKLIVFYHLICWRISLGNCCILILWLYCLEFAFMDKGLITNFDLSLLFLFLICQSYNFRLLSRCFYLLMIFKILYFTCCYSLKNKLLYLADLLGHLLCRSV